MLICQTLLFAYLLLQLLRQAVYTNTGGFKEGFLVALIDGYISIHLYQIVGIYLLILLAGYRFCRNRLGGLSLIFRFRGGGLILQKAAVAGAVQDTEQGSG